MHSLVMRPAGHLDAAQLSAVAAIYAQSFPDHLRVPFAELSAAGPADALHVGLDDDGPVGFAAVRLLDSAGWVFLRYFAVAAQRRREHLGQRQWRLLRTSVEEDGWPSRICFEVEDPAVAAGDQQLAGDEGRIRFWQSCGASLLPVPGYVMPALTSHADPEPMLLMAPGAAELTPGQLTELVLALYDQRYGLPPAHPLVQRAVSSIPAEAGG
jgi:hypothetical protein